MKFIKSKKIAVLFACAILLSSNAYAEQDDDGFKFKMGGYLRENLSFNLQNVPETKDNDRGKPSMARTTLQIEADASKNDISFHVVGRAVGEVKTQYLKNLENMGAASGSLMDKYNDVDLREYYADFKLHDRVALRLGKQQVVWGESDFFQAMDVVHGFDYTWRSFLEPENEDWRKPLFLANVITQVPELNGTLQLLLRPGFDRGEDIGSTYDLFGGRWANQPNKGSDFLAVMPYNYHYKGGDVNDPTWGARWSGTLGPVNYSAAYIQTLGPTPVINSAFAPYQSIPTGKIGEVIYPQTDVYGVTLSGYVPFVDAVVSSEVTYTPNQWYNIGSNFFGGALPGFGGIVKKDTVRSMIRMDNNSVRWTENLLNTSRPSFFSVQVFDTWLKQYNKNDDIVELAGFGAKRKEHTTLVTSFLTMHYMSDRINPQIVVGSDVTNGDYFFIPSVDFSFGNNWRFLVEADFFFPKNDKKPGEIETNTHLLGYFSNNNQLAFRITKQF